MQSAAAPAKQSEYTVSPTLTPFSAPGKQTFILALLLVVCTLALYNPANHFSFINYDDNHYVSDNPHIRTGLTWSTIHWAFTSFDEANWHPLTWISHALDAQLFHMNPAGHHLSSILLHAVNVVLLFLLLVRSTRRTAPSLFVAALFAVHPINVESVAWIAERKNVLSTTFFLLTLAAYGWYALKPGWKQGWKRYSAVAGLLACGLASKPMLVTVPFVLLLVDYWPLRRIEGWSMPSDTLAITQWRMGKLCLEKLPLFLLSVASCVITVRAQQAAGAVGTAPFPFSARFENAIFSYAKYLGKAIWPTRLTLFYPYAGTSLALWKVAAAALVLAAISTVVVKQRSRGYLLAGWLWFLGTLVPVIGVIQVGNQAMADRYAYIPFIGIFVMIAWTAADFIEAKKISFAQWAVPALSAVVALSIASYRQIGYWQDSLAVWTHALQVTEHNFVAEDNMGVALVQLNRVEDAYPFFVRAAEDKPSDPVARLNIGAYLHQHGHTAEAITQYELALHLGGDPGMRATTHSNLGSAYSELGDDTQSRASFEQAVRLNPYLVPAWQGLAALSQKEGNLDDAVRYFARAVELQPSAQGYLQLARALAQANHLPEARVVFQQALSLDPSLAGVKQDGAQRESEQPAELH